ncbi:uncharacterized protein LOC130675678 [Microplitis mediator]|uniref:uncharacterized protein LOC130675678 n=1 Tax=Microplitis mediator TaxID=375433 RepID=UPI0025527EC2|nr:uncharacterized protein LOC130675678 [Microplitis mediator]
MRIVNVTRSFFKDFLKNLKLPTIKNPFKMKTPSTILKSDLKIQADSLLSKFGLHEEVHLSALENSHVEVTYKNGEVHINNHAWHEISFELESGRISKFCEKLSLTSGHFDEMRLRKLHFENVPAKILADIEDGFVMHSKKFGDIGTTKLKNAEKVLTKKSKDKILKFHKKTLLALGLGATAAGITFASTLTEMHNAEGCFLFDARKNASCKLTDRSCAYPQTSNTIKPCEEKDFSQFFGIEFNTNLNLSIRKTLQDPDATIALKDKLNGQNITVDNIEKIIEDHYDLIIEFYKTKTRPKILDPCQLFEESNKPSCVACDSSAPINSYRYLDTTDLSINTKSYCCDDPPVLKALATAFGKGIDALMSELGVSSFFGTFFEYIMYAIVGFILLCGIGFAVSYIRKKKGDDDEVSYSKLKNEDD